MYITAILVPYRMAGGMRKLYTTSIVYEARQGSVVRDGTTQYFGSVCTVCGVPWASQCRPRAGVVRTYF